MTKIRVVLADDHEVVRSGLRTLINAQSHIEVIGEASDGASAVEAAMRLRPDVLILDVSMPSLGGVEATRRVAQESHAPKVLALSMHEDRSYLRQILDAGASGYVLKRSAADELIRAITAVAAGKVYLDPALTSAVVASFVSHTRLRDPLTPDLSARETEVLTLVAKGYSNKEIAGQLQVGVRTIETYKGRCMEKLGLTTRSELVRYALRQGWLHEP